MSVQRYDDVGYGVFDIGPDPEGAWVKYEDYAALEAKCEALRVQSELSVAAERAWEISMMYACGEDGPKSVADKLYEMKAKCAALAAEREIANADNAYLRDQIMCWARECDRITYTHTNKVTDAHQSEAEQDLANTFPASSAFLAEVRASAVDEVCLKISNAIVNCYQDEQIGLDAAATICGDFAAQLRQEAAQ